MIGVISDTHDNLRAIRYWIQRFEIEGVEAVIHAGDFISPFTVEPLASFDGPVFGVFGNNDGDRETLQEKANDHGIQIRQAPAIFEPGDLKVMVSHKPGELPDTPPDEVDLLVHGHTHSPRWDKQKPLLNPGEAGGWISGVSHAGFVTATPPEAQIKTVPAP